jgi:hypothetical protein
MRSNGLEGDSSNNNKPSFSFAAVSASVLAPKSRFLLTVTRRTLGFDCCLAGSTGEHLFFFIAVVKVMKSIHSNSVHAPCSNGSHRGVFVLRFVVRIVHSQTRDCARFDGALLMAPDD